MNELTGAPSYRYRTQKDKEICEDLFDQIYEASRNNWIIIAGTPSHMKQGGLVEDHAYSIISCVKFDDMNGVHYNLLKLKNPHSKSKWTGDWSSSSPLWNKSLK